MNHTCQGIILSASQFKDADLIVSVITSHLGKLRAVVHRARSSKKRFMGGLDVFFCGNLEVSFPGSKNSQSQNLLPTLVRADPIDSYPLLREDLSRLRLCLIGTELVDSLALEGDSEARAFFLPLRELLLSLGTYETAREPMAPSFSVFVDRILELSGFSASSALADSIGRNSTRKEFRGSNQPSSIEERSGDSTAMELVEPLRALRRLLKEQVGLELRSLNTMLEAIDSNRP